MVGDTTVGDELTLHKKYYFNKAPRQLAISTLYSVQCTVYSICNVFMKTPWVIFYKILHIDSDRNVAGVKNMNKPYF
jgi:hypothetical protein